MLRKLLIVVLCGFVQRFECSRMKFESSFNEPIYGHEVQNEPVFNREHFYPRGALATEPQMLSQPPLVRSEPMFGNEPMMPQPLPQQAVLPNDDFLSNNQVMQGEPFIRGEPILRREPFIRREPILKREAFIRSEPIVPSGKIYQNAPIFREGPIFRNEPNAYSFMVSQCQCQEPQDLGQNCPQDNFFQIQRPLQSVPQTAEPLQPAPVAIQQAPLSIQQAPLSIQQAPLSIQQAPLSIHQAPLSIQQAPLSIHQAPIPIHQTPLSIQQAPVSIQQAPVAIQQTPLPIQQPILTHRIFFPKGMLKGQTFRPIFTIPRIQRFVRKNYKPITENIQFQTPPASSTPIQEFNSITNEPVAFSGNFQNQGQQQESTSETAQINTVTARTVPNPLALAQMSSIC